MNLTILAISSHNDLIELKGSYYFFAHACELPMHHIYFFYVIWSLLWELSEEIFYKWMIEDSFFLEKIYLSWLIIILVSVVWYAKSRAMINQYLSYALKFFIILKTMIFKYYILDWTIYKKWSLQNINFISYRIGYQFIDKFLLEYFGPRGIVTILIRWVFQWRKLHTGYIYHYLMWFLILWVMLTWILP